MAATSLSSISSYLSSSSPKPSAREAQRHCRGHSYCLLPDDTWNKILFYADSQSLCALDSTCRALRTFTQSDCFWDALCMKNMCILPEVFFRRKILHIQTTQIFQDYQKAHEEFLRNLEILNNTPDKDIRNSSNGVFAKFMHAMESTRHQVIQLQALLNLTHPSQNQPYGKQFFKDSSLNNLVYSQQPFKSVRPEPLTSQEKPLKQKCKVILPDNTLITFSYKRGHHNFVCTRRGKDAHLGIAPCPIADVAISEDVAYLLDEEGDVYTYSFATKLCTLSSVEGSSSNMDRRVGATKKFHVVLTPNQSLSLYYRPETTFYNGPTIGNNSTHTLILPSTFKKTCTKLKAACLYCINPKTYILYKIR